MNEALDTLRAFERSAMAMSGPGGSGGSGGSLQLPDRPSFSHTKEGGKWKGGVKIAKKLLPVLGVLLLLLIPILILAVPFFTVGALDYALMKAAGILEITASLRKQETAIVQAMLEDGEVASAYAERLASKGIEVGQVTLAGDFVRTNYFIANIEEMDDVAATGGFVAQRGDGALVIRFRGEVITAKNFLAEMATNDELYADFTGATDTPARFFYSSDVDDTLDGLGVSRSVFANWTSTGDYEKDVKKYQELASGALNKAMQLDASTVGRGTSGSSEVHTTSISKDDVESSINDVAVHTVGEKSTEIGAALLNAITSAANTTVSATAYMLVEEPLQRARAGEPGPVNEMINTTLYRPGETTYYDCDTGEVVTQSSSIVEDANFSRMLSGGAGYSMSEAKNFSNDSVQFSTIGSGSEEIGDTSISTPSSTSAKASVGSALLGQQADVEILQRASYSMGRAIDTREISSVSGANFIMNGGLGVANAISGENIGAQAASEATVRAYRRETNELMARAARAERATRNPFDISSPYTFLGKIANDLAIAGVLNKGGSGVLSVVKSTANLASKSARRITGEAVADGDGQELYAIINDACVTVKNAYNVAGNYACDAQTVVSLDYTSYTRENWENDPDVGPSLDEDGNVKEGSELAEFISLGMGRSATIGVKSADICERYKELPGNRGVFDVVLDALTSAIGIYKSCDGVDEYVANGGKYTFADENPQKEKNLKFAAFVLFDKVDSLIRERNGSVARYKEAYYAAHPRDDSPVGRIAALSGLTVDEVKIALRYNSYLATVRNYDASSRYAFGRTLHRPKRFQLIDDENVVENLYYAWCGRSKYGDTRNNVFVV